MHNPLDIYLYQFIDKYIDVNVFQGILFNNTEIEKHIGKKKYFELIDLDYREPDISRKVLDILKPIIVESDYEAWHLEAMLRDFINKPELCKDYLDCFYEMYCGCPNHVNRYKFLGNLGLNYLYWLEDGYLKTMHGNKWQSYYEKYKNDILICHGQLVPVAQLILDSLLNGEIKIVSKGQYTITENLKSQLESDSIIKVNFPR